MGITGWCNDYVKTQPPLVGEGICKWERCLRVYECWAWGDAYAGLGSQSHSVHLSCLHMYIVIGLVEGADSVGEVFAFVSRFQRTWIEDICFQARVCTSYWCCQRQHVPLSGRSATGTRAVIVCCSSLFALVSMAQQLLHHVPLVWKGCNWYQSLKRLFFIVCSCFHALWSCYSVSFLNLNSDFFFYFQKVSFWVGLVLVFRCFSSPPEGTTAVGRCVLNVIFLFVAFNEEPANIQRGQHSFSITFCPFCLK